MHTQAHKSYYKSYFMDPITPHGFHMDRLRYHENPKDTFKMFYPSITSAVRVIVSALCKYFSSKVSL